MVPCDGSIGCLPAVDTSYAVRVFTGPTRDESVLPAKGVDSGGGSGYARTMTQVLVHVPEATPVALGLSAERMGDALLLAAAVRWFESGKLSSGAAAELAGLPKPVFLERLKDFDVPAFCQTGAELQQEFADA